MDTIQTMRVFARVAQRASFAAAGRDLRMSAASVTKHVAGLEARVGVRLLDRTTRSVTLTEAGRVYLERCLEILEAFDEAEAAVGELSRAPSGLLRVTAPFDLEPHLGVPLGRFMAEHPRVTVDVRLSNRAVDLVEEGVDVAVRAAARLESSYVARTLARSTFALAATPEYLARHGRPKRPEDLARHAFVVFAEPRPLEELVFTRGRRQARVHVRGALVTNSGKLARSALLDHLGLAVAPSFVFGADLESGALEHVLPGWRLPTFRVFGLYPHRRFVSPKVRLFVEALREAWGGGDRDPWWPSAPEAPAD